MVEFDEPLLQQVTEQHRASRAFEAAWRADLAPGQALWPGLAQSPTDVDRAWGLALQAHLFQAGLSDAPALVSLAPFQEASADAQGAATLAAALIARGCMLRFDRNGFDQAAMFMSSLPQLGERASLYRDSTLIWQSLLDGGGVECMPNIDALSRDASAAQLGELVIEASVLRAAAALNSGEIAEATKHARRVTRMARAEGMPQQEYLAHLSLARVRRYSGHVHLATRILSSLRSVAPAPWQATLDWELRVAGESVPGNQDTPGCIAQRLITHMVAGDVEKVTHDEGALRARVAGFALAEREAEVVIGALNPTVARESLGVRLKGWASGAESTLPDGLHSIVSSVPSPHTETAGHSWVLARPSTAARRFLHPGIGLLSHITSTEQTRRKHGRTELATAVLALAGPVGVAMPRFVQEVYGFAYSRDAHDGVLRVLLHRMRKNLNAVANIVRADERLILEVLAPFIVPDPRTSEPTDGRVLRAVAANPRGSAKDVAAALGVPLRTVQAALSTLVSDGACVAERKGAAVEYRLEDTTFSDPTRTGTPAGAPSPS